MTTRRKRAAKGEIELWIELALSSDTNDCIIWPYSKTHNGYGTGRYKGDLHRLNRLICELVYGQPAMPDAQALHCPTHCTSRACCNPRHLRWGNAKENADDQLLTDTHRGNTTLTEDEVVAIRVRLGLGATQVALAAEYGVWQTTISDIAHRRTWAHLT